MVIPIDDADRFQSTTIISINWLLKISVMVNATVNTILMQNAEILAHLTQSDSAEITQAWFRVRDEWAQQKYQDVKEGISNDLRDAFQGTSE